MAIHIVGLLSDRLEEYLEDLLEVGTFGASKDEIIERFFCQGVEQAIRDNVISRR